MENIQKIREDIDLINKELLTLFAKRMELSLLAYQEKLKEGKPVFDRKREEEILQWVSVNSPAQITTYSLDFFRKIMELSREYQQEK